MLQSFKPFKTDTFYEIEGGGYEKIIDMLVKCELLQHDLPDFHEKTINEIIEESSDCDIDFFLDWLPMNFDPFEIMTKKVMFHKRCNTCDTYYKVGSMCTICNSFN